MGFSREPRDVTKSLVERRRNGKLPMSRLIAQLQLALRLKFVEYGPPCLSVSVGFDTSE